MAVLAASQCLGTGVDWQAVLRSILAQSNRGPMVVDGTGFGPC
ncbi:Uncharacterized protein PPKH_0560 [Pseudomonas putida]|nr:Uncharacterized protein PPKH_0560 [Pseudomonas putida]